MMARERIDSATDDPAKIRAAARELMQRHRSHAARVCIYRASDTPDTKRKAFWLRTRLDILKLERCG